MRGFGRTNGRNAGRQTQLNVMGNVGGVDVQELLRLGMAAQANKEK